MMNEIKYAAVIDSNGHKVGLVMVKLSHDNDKNLIENIDSYTLKEGERLVYEDIPIAVSMLKPKWNGKVWEEISQGNA